MIDIHIQVYSNTSQKKKNEWTRFFDYNTKVKANKKDTLEKATKYKCRYNE